MDGYSKESLQSETNLGLVAYTLHNRVMQQKLFSVDFKRYSFMVCCVASFTDS